MESAPGVPSGVKELIGRLRDEGVKAGRVEADRLIEEAQKKAGEIVTKANAEAEDTLAKARKEIQSESEAARESIRLAFRDTELKIQSEMKTRFAQHIRRLVSAELEGEDFLRQLILLIAGRASSMVADQPAEIFVDEEIFKAEGKAGELTKKGKEHVDGLILGISRSMLREGVEIKPTDDIGGRGIRIKLVNEDLEIDLSDEVLSDLLFKFLAPRYRAIVQGME